MRRKAIAALLIISSLAVTSRAADSTDVKSLQFTPSGFVSYEPGRLVSAKFKGGEDYGPVGLRQSHLNLTFHTSINDRLRIHLGLEGLLWYNNYNFKNLFDSNEFPLQYFSFYFHHAEGVYTISKSVDFASELGIGLFPYKYNPEVRNLGEYLFRTGTYPGSIQSFFDFPLARLSGLRFSSTAFGFWKNDLLITQEADMWPYHDGTISYVTGAWVFKGLLDCGAGVSFSRLIPVYGNFTTPRKSQNLYETNIQKYWNGTDTVRTADTNYYTFSGTKLVARATIDPKAVLNLLGMERPWFLKPEDGKVYGEAVILGLKDQGIYYDTLAQRIPVAFGMNWFTHPFVSYPLLFPAFAYGITGFDEKVASIDSTTIPGVYDTAWDMGSGSKMKNALVYGGIGVASGIATWLLNRYANIDGSLDLIAMELEYWGNPYPNSTRKILAIRENGIPVPTDPPQGYTAEDYRLDNWKWSLYVKKSIGDHFFIAGQAARDHFRTSSAYLINTDFEESLTRKHHWYWMMKAAFLF